MTFARGCSLGLLHGHARASPPPRTLNELVGLVELGAGLQSHAQGLQAPQLHAAGLSLKLHRLILKPPHRPLERLRVPGVERLSGLRRLDAALPPEHKLFPDDLPLAVELEERFDAVLGPKTRVLGYHRLLPNRALCAEVATARVSELQAAVASRALGLAEFIIRRIYRVNDAHAVEAEAAIEDEVSFAEGLLADGRPFLAGERFTAADLCFAAFLGALMALDTYGHPFPAIEERPAPERAAIEALRARPAGQHIIRLYETERR